jgi:hypothetical protein
VGVIETNEHFQASVRNPNWKNDFWGSNYARLSQIKTKYDPNGVFWVTPGINADEYSVVNGRVCKVPSTDPSFAPANDNTNYAQPSTEQNNSPFPGTTNCTETPGHGHGELPEGFRDEPDLDPTKPGKDGATVTKIRHGPYTVAAGDMISNRPETSLEKPCRNCYITAIQANLEYANGTTANVNTGAWLHHMVLFRGGIGNRDLVCNSLLSPQRIYAAGNERTVSRINGVAKYGIELGTLDRLSMIYDLMNESAQSATYYLSLVRILPCLAFLLQFPKTNIPSLRLTNGFLAPPRATKLLRWRGLISPIAAPHQFLPERDNIRFGVQAGPQPLAAVSSAPADTSITEVTTRLST